MHYVDTIYDTELIDKKESKNHFAKVSTGNGVGNLTRRLSQEVLAKIKLM